MNTPLIELSEIPHLDDVQKAFSDAQLAELCELLAPFSAPARIFIVNFFLRARSFKREFKSSVHALFFVWSYYWRDDQQDRLGDPDICEAGRGMRNVNAFYLLYSVHGLPTPKNLF
jgi:hypothetical protein